MDDTTLEARIGAALRGAVGTLEPDTRALVDGGIQRGRRLHRRHRVVRGLEIASAAAVVAALASMAVILRPDGARPANPVMAASSVPTTAPTTPQATMVRTTPQALLQIALDLLPRAGDTSAYAGRYFDGFVGTNFVYDDGAGAAQVQVALGYPVDDPKAQPITACTSGTAGCTVLADGGHLQVTQGTEFADGHQPNSTEWSVELVRPDGIEVSIFEWNAPQEKDAALSRATPPFTIAQLSTWVTSTRWQANSTSGDVDAAAHLFTADNLDAAKGPLATPSSTQGEQQRETRQARKIAQQLVRCAQAATTHEAAPAGCPATH